MLEIVIVCFIFFNITTYKILNIVENNNYFYIGSYDLMNSKFNATIDIKHYHGKCNPIFGKQEEFILKLTGNSDEEEMLLTAHMLEDPSREIHVRLKYHTEIFHKLSV